MFKNHKINQTFKIILLICFILPLAAHAYIGTYSRLTSDDYCRAALVKQSSVFIGLADQYKNWTGDYTSIFFGLLSTAGSGRFIPFNTATVVILWLVILALSIRQLLFLFSDKCDWLNAFLLSAVLIFALMTIAPNINQTLYWDTGIYAYLPGLITLTGLLGLAVFLIRKPHLKPTGWIALLGGCLLLALIGGGNNETMSVMQVVVFGILFIAALIFVKAPGKKKAILVAGVCLVGAMLALAIVYFAPGTGVRQSQISFTANIIPLLKTSLFAFQIGMNGFFSGIVKLFALLILGLFSFVTGFRNKTDRASKSNFASLLETLLIFLPILIILLVFFSFIPGAFALSKTVPERTMTIPAFWIAMGVFSWFLVFGIWFKHLVGDKIHLSRIRRFALMLALLVLVGFPIVEAVSIFRSQPLLKAYAAGWDAMYAQIVEARSKGEAGIFVSVLPNWAGVEGIENIPDHWVNICASDYFGLTVVTKK